MNTEDVNADNGGGGGYAVVVIEDGRAIYEVAPEGVELVVVNYDVVGEKGSPLHYRREDVAPYESCGRCGYAAIFHRADAPGGLIIESLECEGFVGSGYTVAGDPLTDYREGP